MKKVLLYLLIGAIIIFGLIFGWSVYQYLFSSNSVSGDIHLPIVTRACFLGTPICVKFPSSELPPLWIERQ